MIYIFIFNNIRILIRNIMYVNSYQNRVGVRFYCYLCTFDDNNMEHQEGYMRIINITFIKKNIELNLFTVI